MKDDINYGYRGGYTIISGSNSNGSKFFGEMPWWLKTSILLPAAGRSNEYGRGAGLSTVRSGEYRAVSGYCRGCRKPTVFRTDFVNENADKEQSTEVPASEVERTDRFSLARISLYFLEPRSKKNILQHKLTSVFCTLSILE
jgi:hypothetical protein